MNGCTADLVGRDLRQAELGIQPCLADGPLANRYSFPPTTVFPAEHGGEHTPPYPAGPNLINEWLYGVGPIVPARAGAIEIAMATTVRTTAKIILRMCAPPNGIARVSFDLT